MNLTEALAKVLPQGRQFAVLLVESEPKQCNDLIQYGASHSRFEKPAVTVKMKHFVLLVDQQSGVVVFGIEVYNYIAVTGSKYLNRLFVSKIDTTGLVDLKLNVNKVVSEVLKNIILQKRDSIKYKKKVRARSSSTINKIKKLINNTETKYETVVLPEKVQVSLSLFTKSSNQYFFPNSDKNPSKHLISGEQLLRWWMTLIDAMLSEINIKFSQKLLVPGAINPQQYLLAHWTLGSIFGDDEAAVHNIPNFPDDPKTRFLEHLIVENRYKIGLKEFYDELGFRQEFRLGNVVGVLGCESDVTERTEKDDSKRVVLTNRKYKKLINLIKSEDFNDINDIKILVQTKIPFFLRLVDKAFDYGLLEGRHNYVKQAKAAEVAVNNLTGLIKKKAKR